MNQMHGSWRATVVNIKHPQGMMKAQIKVNGMMEGIPNDDLPWAEYLLPIGYKFTPTNVGDLVWVDFPYDGDSRRPRIIGAAMDWPNGKPNTAPEAGGAGNQYQPPKVNGQPAAPAYTVTQDEVISRNGILEVRTIKGGYSITNMANHATISFNDSGEIIISTSKGVFIHAGADLTLDAGGAIHLKAAGAITQEGANVDIKAKGGFELEAGTATYKAGQHAFEK